MQNPSKSLGLRASIAALVAGAGGMLLGGDDILSPSQKFHRQRGKAPSGKRWTNSSAYVPGGPYSNTRGTFVKNPLVALQMNAMHEKIHGV